MVSHLLSCLSLIIKQLIVKLIDDSIAHIYLGESLICASVADSGTNFLRQVSKWFKEWKPLEAHKKRLSLDRDRGGVKFKEIGVKFPFLNRESECKLLYESFIELDVVRRRASKSKPSSTNWEDNKRDVKVPVTVGMAGIGKSSFAREGIHCHIKFAEVEDEFSNRFKPGKCLNIRIGKL